MGNSCVLKSWLLATNIVILNKNVGRKVEIGEIFDEMHKGHLML